MQAWIIGIVGVICLGVLLEILLPEGQTGKYVKGAFSLMVIFVIIAPLPSLAKALDEWQPEYSTIGADEDFLAEAAERYASAEEEALEDYLRANGHETRVNVVIKDGSMSEIDKIAVTLFLSVMDGEEENIVISSVRVLVADRCGVEPGSVSVSVTRKEDYGSQ